MTASPSSAPMCSKVSHEPSDTADTSMPDVPSGRWSRGCASGGAATPGATSYGRPTADRKAATTPRGSRPPALGSSGTGRLAWKSVTPSVDERGHAVHRAREVDRPVVGPDHGEAADDPKVRRVATRGRDALAHLRDPRWEVGRRRPPRDPAAPEARQSAHDGAVDGAADPDRYPALLRGLGHLVDRVELQHVVAEARPLLAPQRLTDGERVVEERAAPVEVEPGRVVLLALPADAHAEVESPAREDVERRRRLGEHDRSAQRRDEDVRAQPDARRHAADDGQRGERLEPVTVGPGRLLAARAAAELRAAVRLEVLAEHDVVRDDQLVDARRVCNAARSRTSSQPPGSSAANVRRDVPSRGSCRCAAMVASVRVSACRGRPVRASRAARAWLPRSCR